MTGAVVVVVEAGVVEVDELDVEVPEAADALIGAWLGAGVAACGVVVGALAEAITGAELVEVDAGPVPPGPPAGAKPSRAVIMAVSLLSIPRAQIPTPRTP
jgi:hypothetical protein